MVIKYLSEFKILIVCFLYPPEKTLKYLDCFWFMFTRLELNKGT